MRIILIGFGTVAQSLARILTKERDWLVKSYGFEPHVTAIVDSRGSCRDDNGLNLDLALKAKEKHGTVQRYPGKGERKTSNLKIINETEAEVVVETTPSNFESGEPGLTNIKQSLAARKHVVTANKGPLALAMPALLELAEHMKQQLRFSGTVGGGVPFLNFASKCLRGDKLLAVRGILNGTTNYVLTRMENASLSLRQALSEAQKRGLAERDPTNDMEGFDTAAKMVIISNWVLNRRLSINDVAITGISGVTSENVKRARASKRRIKLIGRLSRTEASVAPGKVDMADPICVGDTLNALTFSMEHAGDITLIGEGAGGERTASAIIHDLVDVRSKYLA